MCRLGNCGLEMANNLPKFSVSKVGNIPTLGNGEPKSRSGGEGSRISWDRIGQEQTRTSKMWGSIGVRDRARIHELWELGRVFLATGVLTPWESGILSLTQENVHRDRNNSKKFMNRELWTRGIVSLITSCILSRNARPPPWPLGDLQTDKKLAQMCHGEHHPWFPCPWYTFLYLFNIYIFSNNVFWPRQYSKFCK